MVSAPEALAVQFGTSAMATAAATLSLGEQMTGNPENCRRLDALAAVAAAGELVAAGLAERRYRQAGVEGTLRQSTLGDTYKVGALAVGLGVPLACHAINALSRQAEPRACRYWARWRCWWAEAVMRQAIFQAGNKSAERPQDYFRLTEPRPGSKPAPPGGPRYRSAYAGAALNACSKNQFDTAPAGVRSAGAVERLHYSEAVWAVSATSWPAACCVASSGLVSAFFGRRRYWFL